MRRDKSQSTPPASGYAEPLMNHDLRTALADVVGGLQLMDVTQLSGANKAQMERILASSEALVTLMDELSLTLESDVSDSGDMMRIVDLEEFLDRTRRRWTGVAEQQSLTFTITVDEDLPEFVAVPRSTLERVLSNILENSFKFTMQGSVRLIVEIGRNNDLVFRIQDSGPGFSREAMQTLFEFSGKQSSSGQPGTGFGLYCVKNLLQRLGGKILIENTPQGATVTVRFPATAWRPGPIDTDFVDGRDTSAHMLTGLHFLLAEDNKTSQLVAFNMLDRLGAQVTVVDNGRLAVERIDAVDFDVVLLDIEMPEKSGIEVITEVRARTDAKAGLPLIALTAFVLEEHRAKIMEAGADGIISKPVTNTQEMGRTINRILNSLTRFTEKRDGAGDRTQRLPFIDRDLFFDLKHSVGEQAFYAILEKIQMDLSEIEQEIRAACSAGDMLALRRASHVLISLSGAVGATRLLSNAQSLNAYANAGNQKRVGVKARECNDDIARLIDFVKKQGCVG